MFNRRQFLGLGLGVPLGLMLPSGLNLSNTMSTEKRDINLIRRGRRDLPHIALTFDDCWYEDHTLAIAETFAERGIKLTFFPTGLAIKANIDSPTQGHENLYPRILEMGHEFACHSFSHPDITGLTAHRLLWWEINSWKDVLNEALGFEYEPVTFRPPFGIVTPELYDACWETQLDVVLWTHDLGDHACNGGECSESMSLVMNDALMNGAIILQHTNEPSVRFIEQQIEMIEQAELEPVLLSEMIHWLYNEDQFPSTPTPSGASSPTQTPMADVQSTPTPTPNPNEPLNTSPWVTNTPRHSG